MKQKGVIEEIKGKSAELSQRIVIDEELPGDSFRILIAGAKKAEMPWITVSAHWGEEEERYVSREELGTLLDKKQMARLGEGQVFRVKAEKADDRHEKVRQHMKKKAKPLLKREGEVK